MAGRLDEAKQLCAVMFHITLWIILPLVSLWLPFYLLFTRFWFLMCAYAVWYYIDFDTPAKGSRNCCALRESRIWKHFADYFPITLVKTAELPPNKNYILGCHPHGVLSVGAFTHLCTNGTGFMEKFPGLTSNILTLTGQFYFPFRREFGLLLGGCESSRRSLDYLLSSQSIGRCIGIVVGGAEEALDAHDGKHHLNLSHRRGFCKYALKYGAALVPSYSFGENDVFIQSDNERGTNLRQVQTLIKKVCGFCPPLFHGRGLLYKSFGLLPFRKPITTVVGAPIQVEKVEEPTHEQINELHQKYVRELTKLFNEHKSKYGMDQHDNLVIH
ncbi:unnamed protein product [Bursaphelenchus okinawaensis]|uniref:Acyltransferase n=1 Tax=Bursaphelenchus okinawaensis TaxID=465554 RepID=A0A811KG97_9BILA|nr:unnamed protein product [Bursaphelenchus okinawaensis]CAG9102853.1 unnamed protein product [Bursaphelenchus okinawaensis]